MTEWDLFQIYKDGSTSANQSTWYKTWRIKIILWSWHIRKSIWQNSTFIYNKNSQQSGYRGSMPQHKKGHIWQAHSHPHSTVTSWKLLLKIRKRTRMSTLATFIQHSTRSPSHSSWAGNRNKRHINLKGRSKTITSSGRCDFIYRKP